MAVNGSGWLGIDEGVDNGDTVEDKLTSAFTNIDSDIAGVDTRTKVLEEIGLLLMSGTDLVPQTIAVTPTKVVLYDSKPVEAGVGVIGDVANSKATATLDGIFKIRFEAFVSYASNVDVTWLLYKNGAPTGNGITLSGQGATVFQIILLTSSPLVADDFLELYAEASASTDITMTSTNGTLEKTSF